MENVKGAMNLRSSSSSSMQVISKQAFLPPRTPVPTSQQPSCMDHGLLGWKGSTNAWDVRRHHQRSPSESFLTEEQPSWIEDLLNEPETPVRRGLHRRSSSDSFTFFDGTILNSNLESLHCNAAPSWGAQELYGIHDMRHGSYHPLAIPFNREPTLKIRNYQPGHGMNVKRKVHFNGTANASVGSNAVTSTFATRKNPEEYSQASERIEGSFVNHSQTEADAKHAKQQYAQRSRVRKLQYIAELERKVQALQAEGLDISAEMGFLSQQNIMLDLENKALKQRLESLAQEQLIKHIQQEMFEREIARLKLLQQQQQMQQTSAPKHGRSSSRDLDGQFASFSLKHNNPNAGHDPVSGPLRI